MAVNYTHTAGDPQGAGRAGTLAGWPESLGLVVEWGESKRMPTPGCGVTNASSTAVFCRSGSWFNTSRRRRHPFKGLSRSPTGPTTENAMTTPTNTFEVRYPEEVHTHPVASAGFLAVRFSGGVGVVIVVSCDQAGGPDFSMVLPLQGLSLEPGSEWPFRLMNLSATGIGVPPMMTDVDFHLVPAATVTVLGSLAGTYHLRLVGETGAWTPEAGFATTITIDAAFEFRGFTQHDGRPVQSPNHRLVDGRHDDESVGGGRTGDGVSRSSQGVFVSGSGGALGSREPVRERTLPAASA